MELALIFIWTTITNFWGKWGKLTKMTFKWLGELVMAGYKKVISMADLTSWQARYLSEFAPHSWTETYRSIIHEFHALIFTLYSPLSFFFFFKKGMNYSSIKKVQLQRLTVFQGIENSSSICSFISTYAHAFGVCWLWYSPAAEQWAWNKFISHYAHSFSLQHF